MMGIGLGRDRRPGTGVFAAALVALAGVAFAEGNVNGVAEQPVIEKIAECRSHEAAALSTLGAYADNDRPSAEDAATATSQLETARASIAEAIALIDAGGFQASTDAATARRELESARAKDDLALGKLEKGKKVRGIRADLNAAQRAKRKAMLAMQGIVKPDENNLQAYDRAGSEVAYVQPVARTAQPHRTYGPHESRARARTKKKKSPRPAAAPRGANGAKGPRTPADYYYAFRPAGSSAENPGFAVYQMQRDLIGPFQGGMTAGVFDLSENTTADVSTASVCFEFDLKGSAPPNLEFFVVCVRYVSGGIQVYAASHDGNAGNTFLPGEHLVDVRVTYSNGVFTAQVKPAGASADAWTTFAQYEYGFPAAVLVSSFGGSGFQGRRAELGIDDIWLSPLE